MIWFKVPVTWLQQIIDRGRRCAKNFIFELLMDRIEAKIFIHKNYICSNDSGRVSFRTLPEYKSDVRVFQPCPGSSDVYGRSMQLFNKLKSRKVYSMRRIRLSAHGFRLAALEIRVTPKEAPFITYFKEPYGSLWNHPPSLPRVVSMHFCTFCSRVQTTLVLTLISWLNSGNTLQLGSRTNLPG